MNIGLKGWLLQVTATSAEIPGMLSELIALLPWWRSVWLPKCEGCFCNNATWRAEGDHDMDFDIEKRGSQTQNSTEGPKFGPRASGTLLKNIQKPKSLKPKNNMNKDQGEVQSKRHYR
jgi:hypothetical protein